MSPPSPRRVLTLVRPPATPQEALEELEFAEEEIVRGVERAATLEWENERLRDENLRLLADLEHAKKLHDGTASIAEVLSSGLLESQCRNAELEAELAFLRKRPEPSQHEREVEMARQLIRGLEERCASYESRVGEMKHQLARLSAVVKLERAVRARKSRG